MGQLRNWLPEELYGFVPQKEATELWYSVQLLLEASCQGGWDVIGFSTDLVKAFNHLPRAGVFAIARQGGLPEQLLQPWELFLQHMGRRFKVKEEVGQQVLSVTGFPEGCPLSPLAMLLTDWAFHCYMREFAPAVRCLCFVDNLSATGSDLSAVARGFSAVVTFCEALDLQLDEEKTFFWATDPQQRPPLVELGHHVVTDARELGGTLSYHSRVHNHEMVARIQSLGPLWQALKRSRAPVVSKLAVLPVKFWAKALHGVAGVPLGESHLQSLRAAATAAIGMALAPDLAADPGFYQLWVCVRDLRRMPSSFPTSLLPGERSWLPLMDVCSRDLGPS